MRKTKTHGPFTHIYERFRGYTRADCACCYCLHYTEKPREPCPFEQCKYEQDRLDAAEFDRQNEKMWNKFSDETIYK
jgi:hypothetical protein